jgi:hypothetical protein
VDSPISVERGEYSDEAGMEQLKSERIVEYRLAVDTLARNRVAHR